MTFGSFLPNLIRSLPSWLINLGAVVILILFVVLALAPRMITGTLTCTTYEGTRCTKLSINGNFEGRDVRTQVIDGTGTFYIPVYSFFSPQQVSIYHVKQDVELRIDYTMTFALYPVWAGKQFNISLSEASPGKFSKPEMEMVGGNWLALLDVWVSSATAAVLPAAHAAELMTYEQLLNVGRSGRRTGTNGVQLPADTLGKRQSAEISEAVSDAIAKAAADAKVTASTEALVQFTAKDMERFNAILQQDTGTVIRPEHWQYMDSEKSAVDYVKSIKALELEYPGIFDDNSVAWSKVEAQFQARTGQTIVVVPKM
jgi:hypothetical protein